MPGMFWEAIVTRNSGIASDTSAPAEKCGVVKTSAGARSEAEVHGPVDQDGRDHRHERAGHRPRRGRSGRAAPTRPRTAPRSRAARRRPSRGRCRSAAGRPPASRWPARSGSPRSGARAAGSAAVAVSSAPLTRNAPTAAGQPPVTAPVDTSSAQPGVDQATAIGIRSRSPSGTEQATIPRHSAEQARRRLGAVGADGVQAREDERRRCSRTRRPRTRPRRGSGWRTPERGTRERSATLRRRFSLRERAGKESQAYGQDHRHRPRHDELVHGRPRGRRADRHRERRGRSHHPVRRRLHAGGERLVGTVAKRQAVTNPQNTVFSIKRFMGRKEAEVREEESIVPYKVVSGPNGDARVDAGGKQYSPARDQRDDPRQAQGRRRGLPRRDRRRRRHHRPRVLQRRPAPGDQGRRQDRRPRRQAHHQRADRRVAGLRPRQGDRPDDPRLRPRRRHVRRVRAGDRRRRLRGQVDRG